ncbi:MAG: hypothetical protein ACJATI_001039 [Halioglobus sp.]|jgi:hypothetical protein
MIRWWGEELNLTSFYRLEKEDLPATNKSDSLSPEELMSQIESDPFELDTDRSAEDIEMSKFQENQEAIGLNMAVVMYMKDAQLFMKSLSKKQVQDIGFEIAEIGRYGIDPAKKEVYSLRTVPNKKLTGYAMLSWMYVAYSIFDPGLEKQLGLDFEKELLMSTKL